MSIFVPQGICWLCPCQQTPACSTPTSEQGPVPSLFRSPLWHPDFCHMHTSDMLLVMYKATNPLKIHTSALALAFNPKGKSNQRDSTACGGIVPFTTLPEGTMQQSKKGKKRNMHKIQPQGKLYMSQEPRQESSTHPQTSLFHDSRKVTAWAYEKWKLWHLGFFWNRCF